MREILEQIDGLWAIRPDFNPECDERSFGIMASDYVMLILLRPLLARLETVAPAVRISLIPVVVPFRAMLGRGEVDLVVFPIEVDPGMRDFAHRTLFTDRYVCTVWNQHPDVGEEITLEMLTRLPYLGCSCAEHASSLEAQLDAAGVERRREVSTTSFASQAANPSGYGEGQRYLGAIQVTTDADGNAAFTVHLPLRDGSRTYFTATATGTATGPTSEFSRALPLDRQE